MKIKDHHSIIFWPPVWMEGLDYESIPFEKMDELVLREVEIIFSSNFDYHSYIYVSAEYGRNIDKFFKKEKAGKIYYSKITFLKDTEFLNRLYQKLRSSIGQTIREIGESEI
jgi:hypothetical protein